MEAAIIGVLGAGLLGLLGVFLQAIRSDIRALGERMDLRFEESETRLLARIQQGEERLLVRIQEGEERLLVRIQEGEDRLLARIEEGEERLSARAGSLETAWERMKTDLGEVKERLARIEATQAEHGRLLAHMMGHGERIAALEGAAAAG